MEAPDLTIPQCIAEIKEELKWIKFFPDQCQDRIAALVDRIEQLSKHDRSPFSCCPECGSRNQQQHAKSCPLFKPAEPAQ